MAKRILECGVGYGVLDQRKSFCFYVLECIGFLCDVAMSTIVKHATVENMRPTFPARVGCNYISFPPVFMGHFIRIIR